MKSITQDIKYYQAILSYADQHGVTKAAIKYRMAVMPNTSNRILTTTKCGSRRECHTSHVTEKEIKTAFVTAFNRLVTGQDEIIESARLVRQTLCDTTALTEEKAKLQQELAQYWWR